MEHFDRAIGAVVLHRADEEVLIGWKDRRQEDDGMAQYQVVIGVMVSIGLDGVAESDAPGLDRGFPSGSA